MFPVVNVPVTSSKASAGSFSIAETAEGSITSIPEDIISLPTKKKNKIITGISKTIKKRSLKK